MEWQLAALLMFGLLIILLIFNIPIAGALGGTGIIFMLLIVGPQRTAVVFSTEIVNAWTNYNFLPAAFFILMGELLLMGKISDAVFDMASKWLGGFRGGLALVTIGACAIFATICGSTMAATAAIGSIAIPQMRQRGYNTRMATGVVGAAGGLAHLIPPSVLGVIYCSITEQSVGRLFMAGFVPGIVLAISFTIIVLTWVRINPTVAPTEASAPWRERLSVLRKGIAPVIVVLAVLGSIYTGAATVTEAAALGSIVSVIIAVAFRRFSWGHLSNALDHTIRSVAMMMLIVAGAVAFTWVVNYYLIPQGLVALITGSNINRWVVMILIQAAWFILGMFLDNLGVMLVTVPTLYPVILGLGFDPIWFGILYLLNMEMAFITPPVGLNLFVIKSMVPDIPMKDIIIGCNMFLIGDVVTLLLMMALPQLVLWLPNMMST